MSTRDDAVALPSGGPDAMAGACKDGTNSKMMMARFRAA
jgi:hypothetical protein